MKLNFTEILKGLIAIILIVAISFSLGKCSAGPSEFDKWKTERDSVLKSNEILKKENKEIVSKNDSIDKILNTVNKSNQQLDERLKQQRAKTNSLQQRNDSLYKELENIEVAEECREAVDAAKKVAEGYREETQELRKEVLILNQKDVNNKILIGGLQAQRLNDSKIIGNLTTENRRLTNLVNDVPDPDKELFGLIPLPSRKTSFVVGVVTGIGVALVIDNNINRDKQWQKKITVR